MSRPSPRFSCKDGRHKPHRRMLHVEDGVQRTICQTCGCLLVRTLATRKWFRSGTLGDTGFASEGEAQLPNLDTADIFLLDGHEAGESHAKKANALVDRLYTLQQP